MDSDSESQVVRRYCSAAGSVPPPQNSQLSELVKPGLTSLPKRLSDNASTSNVLQGVSHRHISDHLSEPAEWGLTSLLKSLNDDTRP